MANTSWRVSLQWSVAAPGRAPHATLTRRTRLDQTRVPAVSGPQRSAEPGRQRVAATGSRQRKGRIVCRATSEDEAVSGSFETVTVTLQKPLGLVLGEREQGRVVVEEIIPGSHADTDGRVHVGDILSACSAVVLKSRKEGNIYLPYDPEAHTHRPYDSWDRFWFETEGEDLKTVTHAIGSNDERWGYTSVDLRLKRPAKRN